MHYLRTYISVFRLLVVGLGLGLSAAGYGQTRPTSDQVAIERRLIEGKKYELLSDWAKAEAAYKAILETDVHNSVACYELARTLAAADKPKEALTYIQKAVRLEPNNEWYHLMEADVHEKIGDIYAAMEVYDRLIGLRPEQPHFYEVLIDLCRKTGESDRLLQVLDRYQAITGVTEMMARIRFETLDALGRTDEALAALERLSEVYPGQPDYKFLAASYARQIGREDKAVAYYRAILATDPANARARLALAGTEKQAGDTLAYLSSIESVLTNPTLDIDVKLEEIVPYVLTLSKNPSPSLGRSLEDISRRLIEAHPREAKAYALRGDITSILGLTDEAIRAYRAAIDRDANVYLLWEQLIGLQMQQFDYAGMLATATDGVEYFPNQSFLYYAAGYGAYHTRAYQAALDWLTQALPMTARNEGQRINVLNMLGLVHDKLGQIDPSVEAFETALSIRPGHLETMAYYALTLSQRILDSQKAREMADRVAADARATPILLRTVAEVYMHQKLTDKALQAIRRAAAGPLDPAGYKLAGDLSDQAGEPEQALVFWQMALDAGLQDESIRQKIAQRKTQ